MKILKPFAALFVLLFFIMQASGCGSNAQSPASQVSTVQSGNINVSILASGSLMTSKEYNLAFYSAGTVRSILVKVGDMVKEGDVLAQLDTASLENSLAQAEISVKQARLNLENALQPPPDPLNVEIKELALKNAKNNVVEAEKKLQQATIMAPFNGLVTEVNAVEGDQVSASTAILRLIDPENFETTVYVNETEIYNVKIGTPATVKVVALPNKIYTAKVSSISETATISSNVVNYKVTVKLDPVNAETGAQVSTGTKTSAATPQQGPRRQPGAGQPAPSMQQSQTNTSTNTRLKEGLTVTVSIIVDEKNGILLVPNQAITSRGNRYYVQVVTSAGATEERSIQVGITDGTNTEVVSGLSENEQVSISAAATSTSATSTQRTGTQTSTQQVQRLINSGGSMGGPSGR